MKKALVTLLTAILTITPFVMDRNFYVTNARRGIDLNITGGISTSVINNAVIRGTFTGAAEVPADFTPAYQQISRQINNLNNITQNLYSNFGK